MLLSLCQIHWKMHYFKSLVLHSHLKSSLGFLIPKQSLFPKFALKTNSNSLSVCMEVERGGSLISPCISLGSILGSQHWKEDRLGGAQRCPGREASPVWDSSHQGVLPASALLHPFIWAPSGQGGTRFSLPGTVLMPHLHQQTKWWGWFL